MRSKDDNVIQPCIASSTRGCMSPPTRGPSTWFAFARCSSDALDRHLDDELRFHIQQHRAPRPVRYDEERSHTARARRVRWHRPDQGGAPRRAWRETDRGRLAGHAVRGRSPAASTRPGRHGGAVPGSVNRSKRGHLQRCRCRAPAPASVQFDPSRHRSEPRHCCGDGGQPSVDQLFIHRSRAEVPQPPPR